MACPYTKGDKLKLQKHDKSKADIKVEVEELYTVMTTCSMKVKLLDSKGGPEFAVLKLYDRRFAGTLRDDGTPVCQEWDKKLEREYVEFIRSGEAVQFVKSLDDLEDDSDEHRDWNAMQCEAYTQDLCRQHYEDESSAYSRLEEYQGKQIPNFYGGVHLLKPSPLPKEADKFSEEQKDLLKVYGILIEYIPGPTLRNMPKPDSGVKQNAWEGIVKQATELVSMCHENDMIHKELLPTNILAVEDKGLKGGYRVMLIDFCDVVFRDQHSDYDWGRANFDQYNEHDIAKSMAAWLRKFKLDLQSVPANPFAEFQVSKEEWEKAQKKPHGEAKNKGQKKEKLKSG